MRRAHRERGRGKMPVRKGLRDGTRRVEGWEGKRFGNWARVRKKQEGNRKLSLEPESREGEANWAGGAGRGRARTHARGSLGWPWAARAGSHRWGQAGDRSPLSIWAEGAEGSRQGPGVCHTARSLYTTHRGTGPQSHAPLGRGGHLLTVGCSKEKR
ncbi:unnamed protein product, partial [Gulo gulo]